MGGCERTHRTPPPCLRSCDEPQLPRRRKQPRRFETGTAEPELFEDVKFLYRSVYYEALDLSIAAVHDRFDQPGFKVYRNLQDLLLKVARGEHWEECFKPVIAFYGDNLDVSQLRLHLEILGASYPNDRSKAKLNDIIDYVRGLSTNEQQLISAVVTVIQLILVMPATNAISERSFSAMRRLKTYLRATMKQERLNHLLLLQVHKKHTDELSLPSVANDFVSGSEHRLSIFGRF